MDTHKSEIHAMDAFLVASLPHPLVLCLPQPIWECVLWYDHFSIRWRSCKKRKANFSALEKMMKRKTGSLQRLCNSKTFLISLRMRCVVWARQHSHSFATQSPKSEGKLFQLQREVSISTYGSSLGIQATETDEQVLRERFECWHLTS